MQLFELLKREITQPTYPLIAFSALSGISNAFLIGVINTAAETVANNTLNWKLSILYILCVGIFFLTKRYILDTSAQLVETVINRVRYRLTDKIRHTELATLEKHGTATIYARISQDATVISQVTTTIINGSQSVIIVTFILLYIASISIWSFAMILAGLAFGMFYYTGHISTFRKMWRAVSAKETAFFEKLGHILQGFKEININRLKNENVFKNFVVVNDNLRDHRIKTSQLYNITLLFCEMFIYLLLAIVLFVLPKFHAEHADAIIKIVAAILFIIGPLDAIIFSLPAVANANNSATNIMKLENQLEEELKKFGEHRLDPNNPAAWKTMSFENNIQLKDLSYQYPSKNGMTTSFQVGPMDLTIKKGELIFVTGGNGSGKSTFLKLFTGLYKPNTGTIQLDSEKGKRGALVNLYNYQQYQNLFTTIFSDYHLLDKLYGVAGEIDPERVNNLLAKMQLPPQKTMYQGGSFTNIQLSSGQKKRLALATAILEDKAICIFDEVAADLDPAFRDTFYYEILPELKEQNKTLLVVSHDQQYWMTADRLLNFQDGIVRELSKEEVKSLVSMAVKNEH